MNKENYHRHCDTYEQILLGVGGGVRIKELARRLTSKKVVFIFASQLTYPLDLLTKSVWEIMFDGSVCSIGSYGSQDGHSGPVGRHSQSLLTRC